MLGSDSSETGPNLGANRAAKVDINTELQR
jgi:hypothetical protein